MKIIFPLILFSSFLFMSCSVENKSACQFKVTVVDKTGLDGCKLLFQLENDEFIEPVEWAVEKPGLSAGEAFFITYEPVTSATICMAGETVKITCISEVD